MFYHGIFESFTEQVKNKLFGVSWGYINSGYQIFKNSWQNGLRGIYVLGNGSHFLFTPCKSVYLPLSDIAIVSQGKDASRNEQMPCPSAWTKLHILFTSKHEGFSLGKEIFPRTKILMLTTFATHYSLKIFRLLNVFFSLFQEILGMLQHPLHSYFHWTYLLQSNA